MQIDAGMALVVAAGRRHPRDIVQFPCRLVCEMQCSKHRLLLAVALYEIQREETV